MRRCTVTLVETRLLQRLKKPKPPGKRLLENAHRVFGGNMLLLSEEAWDLLDPIFLLDYMGAAEYEFGILPRTLGGILDDAKKGDLVATSFQLKGKDVKPNWARGMADRKERRKIIEQSKAEGKKPPRAKKTYQAPIPNRQIYVLCRGDWCAEVHERIRWLAKEGGNIKAGSHMERALDPMTEYDLELRGWVELNNGFFFFVDENMWRKVCELFGVGDECEGAAATGS
jgi:hypothetical protein